MIIERIGDLGEFFNRVTTELFSGDLGEGEQYIIRFSLHDIPDSAGHAKELMRRFYDRHNFEFSDDDSDTLLHTVINRLYSDNTTCDSFTLLSRDKVSCVNVMVLLGEELKITIVINSLNNSVNWKARDYFYKDLQIDDLLKDRRHRI